MRGVALTLLARLDEGRESILLAKSLAVALDVPVIEADSLDFLALTIPDAELLDVPGAGGSVTGANGTVAQGINDSGYISGSWVDDTGANHGFIAAPH